MWWRSPECATPAAHVVIACGSEPIVPPVPGLRELQGGWGTREATSMRAIPRSLLVLGGGPAGVELPQAVRRLGGEVTVVDGAERVLAREAAPLGEALGEVLRRDGIALILGAHATRARHDGEGYVYTAAAQDIRLSAWSLGRRMAKASASPLRRSRHEVIGRAESTPAP